jgi:hypothetical protein
MKRTGPLTDRLVDPHSPFWRTLVDAFSTEDDPIVLDQERASHPQIVVVETTYGKTTKVLKFRTIITNNPTFGPYRATTHNA